jgi:uncharacterized protein (DUF1015 family)
MAVIAPFRALRPLPAVAAHVAAVPYDVVTADEARELCKTNPLSFLHVSRAEVDLPPGTNPYSDAVYRRAVENFRRVMAEAPLVSEAAESIYVYRLRAATHLQTGVAACFSIDEYERGVIKKHEHTRRDKEDDRTRHIVELGAQTGPVWLVYAATPGVDQIVDRIATTAPLFDFTAADGVRHTVWRAAEAEARLLIDAFGVVPSLYIADGHHRAASAARARTELRQRGATTRGADTFLAVAFRHDQMQILPYNRVVKDLLTHTAGSLLAELRQRFPVEEGSAPPRGKGEVSMFLAGRWYTIGLGQPETGRSRADQLDVSRLQALVFAPLLGIGDVRTDTRIDFVGGARGTSELENLVASGQAAVAFSVHPVTVADLMAVSDEGAIMPPKSTWFEPKLRDGLLSHML